MDFWEEQKKARKWTAVYIAMFLILAAVAAVIIEVVIRSFDANYQPGFPVWGVVYIGVTCLVAFFQYAMYKTQGGSYVAESMGARQVDPNTSDFQEKQLMNIVHEVAVASSEPVPAVFILEVPQMNAFAAGITPDNAAVCITRGALDKLNREEVQGVIAHEFGHIHNGDMKIGLRLAALVMGFFFIVYFGIRMLQIARLGSMGQRRGANPVVLIAFAFVVAGAFTYLFGSILRASVSRQREYLADASAVQFTRSPRGLASALRKIANLQSNDMPPAGMAYSHLYIDNHIGFSSMIATHPPIEKRIAVLEGKE